LQGPKPLGELEELAVKYFNKAGLFVPGPENAKPELRRIEGEPEPFDTPAFRKVYKVFPCPEGECTNGHCTRSEVNTEGQYDPWRSGM
jgi:hypothetical protein